MDLPTLAEASGWVLAFSLAFAIIRAFWREDLVAGRTYRRAIGRGDFWRDRALAGTQLAEIATAVAEEHDDAR